MEFTAISFPLFIAVVFLLFRSVSFARGKTVLLMGSFFFYGYWFPPYILLLLTSGCIDYWASKRIAAEPSQAKAKPYLLFSLFSNLFILGFFKYGNFFLETTAAVRSLWGGNLDDPLFIKVILPIGISFYTFQSISYTMDVYRGKLEPCQNYRDFFLYLCFFPQLVAGPIVRAVDFLPQLEKRQSLTAEDLRFSLYRICRGYFLKVFIADQIARSSDSIFAMEAGDITSPLAWRGALCFSIQIFCDFSGYSDIAIGVSRLFGFRIKENFNNPYFARGLEDFWRRWHISLSSWFRDYLYIPLGGNRCSRIRKEFNIITVFVVSGFWHGANWTFLLWGLCHGLGVFIDKLYKNSPLGRMLATVPPAVFAVRLLTFVVVVFLWVPFRAPDLSFTWQVWSQMIDLTGIVEGVRGHQNSLYFMLIFLFYCVVQFSKETFSLRQNGVVQNIEMAFYFAGILLAPWRHTDFIYFQF